MSRLGVFKRVLEVREVIGRMPPLDVDLPGVAADDGEDGEGCGSEIVNAVLAAWVSQMLTQRSLSVHSVNISVCLSKLFWMMTFSKSTHRFCVSGYAICTCWNSHHSFVFVSRCDKVMYDSDRRAV